MNEKANIRIVEVVPHNPLWEKQFLFEAENIKNILKDQIVNIHHIGSTSIPGIYAKPIIDILVEVQNIDKVDDYNEEMSIIGYISRGEWGISGRRYFIKGLYERTHHVHIYQKGDSEINRHLLFKDYMINHPEEAKQYENLKKMLANKYRYNPAAYIDGKDEFIKDIDRKALKWKRKSGIDSAQRSEDG